MMRNSIKALALSLLMPALVLAFFQKRDVVNMAYGAGDTLAQEYITGLFEDKAQYQGVPSKLDKPTLLNYVKHHGFRAYSFGQIHQSLLGPWILQQAGQTPQITNRDRLTRATGQLAAAFALNEFGWKSAKPALVLDPTLVWAAAKYVWNSSPQLQADVASADNLIQSGIASVENVVTGSATTPAKSGAVVSE